MTPEQFKDLAFNLRFAFSSADLLLSLQVLFMAIGTIWLFKDDKPKGERFHFIMGIFFHWIATMLGRTIDILREDGLILVRTAHMLTSINLVFVFIAGTFYTKALSGHTYPNYWKYSAYILVAYALIVFSLRYWIF